MNKKSFFYPSAIDWMWNYCIFLGSYIAPGGTEYDLGIWVSDNRISAAIVYGDEPGSYYSGDLNIFGLDGLNDHDHAYEETRKRARNLGYIK